MLRKKAEQEAKEEIVKDSKQSKSSNLSAQKRSKVKNAESTKKKAAKKTESRIRPADWWNSLRQYLREVLHELRKVVWPSRKETVGSTAVVLVIVMLAAFFLGLVDLTLSRVVRLLIG